jgi:hypothetical protein
MWNTIEEFADWYRDNGYPIRPPFEDPVYVTDISYSYVLYREGQYQAELYLVRPNVTSPEHSHPGVENIIMLWGGNLHTTINGTAADYSKFYEKPNDRGTNVLFGLYQPKLTEEHTHSISVGAKGGAFLSIEKWPEGVTPNSVTINWCGEPVDENHGKIIDILEGTKP